MSELSHPGPVVLHIGPEPALYGPLVSLEHALAAHGLALQSCSDVYRALARLCRSRGAEPRVAIVCTDLLDEQESEFFALLARLHPPVDVYVYGENQPERGGGAAPTAKAFTEPAVASLIDRLTPGPAAGPAVTEPGVSLDPAEVPCDSGGEEWPATADESYSENDTSSFGPEEHDVTSESDAGSASAPASDDREDEIDGPVRVPWRSYGDAPKRTPPSQRRGPSAPKPPHRDDPALDEPLLTEEELQALIGDDISAIAPEEPHRLRRGRHEEGDADDD